MAVNRGGLGSKGPQNSFKRLLFKYLVWEIVKSPFDQHCIATMASVPLTVRSKLEFYLLVILYGELLLKKAAIYVVK
jgi:hypothetical protein